MKKFILTNVIILSSLLFLGCSDKQDTEQTNNQVKPESVRNNATDKTPVTGVKTNPQVNPVAQGAAHPVTTTSNSGTQNNTLNSGIVEQVLQSGGYTYIKTKSNGKSVWLAGSQSPLKEGQEIFWGDFAVMRNFTSKSLNKTFDEILFVSGFTTSKPNSIKTVPTANANTGQVISAHNSAGYSYIEVDANGNTLWLAAPLTDLKANDQITWNGASKMQNFTSKSLNKTFKEILFVGSVQVANNMNK